MKKKIKKIILNRETLRNLNAQDLGNAAGGKTIPCYPQTYGPSCRGTCPVQPITTTNCA